MAPLQRGLRGCPVPTPGCRPWSPLRPWRPRRCSVHFRGTSRPALPRAPPCLRNTVQLLSPGPCFPDRQVPGLLLPLHYLPGSVTHSAPATLVPFMLLKHAHAHRGLCLDVLPRMPSPTSLVCPGGRVLLEFHPWIKCHFPEGCHPPSHTTPRPKAQSKSPVSLRVSSPPQQDTSSREGTALSLLSAVSP